MKVEVALSRMDRRIRMVLLSLAILCTLLPVVAVLFAVDSEYRKAALNHDSAITAEMADRLSATIVGARRQLESVAAFVGANPEEEQMIQSFLNAIRGSNRDLLEVQFTRGRGTIVSGTAGARMPALPFTGRPVFHDSARPPFVSVSVETTPRGDGFLTAAVSMAALSGRLRSLAASRSARAFLLDVDGRALASSDGGRPHGSFYDGAGIGRSQRMVTTGRGIGAPTWYVTEAPVGGTSWAVLYARRAQGLLSAGFPLAFGSAAAAFAVVMALFGAFVLRRTSVDPAQRRLASLVATSRSLEDTVRHNEMLVRETHHRVKNDLQILSSMLNLSDRPGINSVEHEILTDSKNRVHAISLIHELLYKSPDLAGVSMRGYVAELIRRIESSLVHDAGAVSIVSRVGDFYFDADTSVVCGLLLNELLTNSLKYAFPDGESGVILVRVERIADGGFLLQVQDDGVGLPKDCTITGSSSLGMRLVGALTEQLGGTWSVESDAGTSWNIRFSAVEVAANQPVGNSIS